MRKRSWFSSGFIRGWDLIPRLFAYWSHSSCQTFGEMRGLDWHLASELLKHNNYGRGCKICHFENAKLPLNYHFRTEYHCHCVFFEQLFPSSETKTWKTTGRICKYSSWPNNGQKVIKMKFKNKYIFLNKLEIWKIYQY